jgi:hypothetical protein
LLASNIAENEWWAETAAGDARASTATPASHKPERAFIATLGTLEIIVARLAGRRLEIRSNARLDWRLMAHGYMDITRRNDRQARKFSNAFKDKGVV